MNSSENASEVWYFSQSSVPHVKPEIPSAWLSEPSRAIPAEGPNRLLIDIENSPAMAYVWGLFNEDINLQRLVAPKELLCFAAKWVDEPEVFWYSAQDKEQMLRELHNLLNEADVVIHYNGDSHDMPIINTELIKAGYLPPSPYRSVDLYKTVRHKFKFTSGKLEYVLKELGLPEKASDGGFETWVGCMQNESWAWQKMHEYNQQDVITLEALYHKVLPWVDHHLSYAAFSQEHCCPNCGSTELVRRGYAYTKVSQYQQWRCNDCGKWSRSTRREYGVGITEVPA